jgi:hypothetical protein
MAMVWAPMNISGQVLYQKYMKMTTALPVYSPCTYQWAIVAVERSAVANTARMRLQIELWTMIQKFTKLFP